MKKGFWRLIGRMPALALAVAVSPIAMADDPPPYGSADGGPASAAAIPTLDMHAFRPIQPTTLDSPGYDSSYAPAPPAAPAAVVVPPAGPPPGAPMAPMPPTDPPVYAAPVPPATQPAPCAPPAYAAPACAPPVFTAPSCYCGPDGGCCFQFAPDRWCNVGAGIRTSFNSLTGNEVTDKNYFAVDEARLFFSGRVTRVIGFELNTDISGAGGDGFTDSSSDRVNLPDSIHMLDAIVKFEFNDYVNFWFGRMITPSDRINMSNVFFINGWDVPFVSNYPSVFEGRDDGATYWGQYAGGHLKWMFGAYNGQGRFSAGNDWPLGTGPNTTGNMEYAMRVVLNLLDPEPGYYEASTYFGQRNVAAVGFALQDQPDALTDTHHTGTFLGWNVDFLFENKMTPWGSGTLEGAYYNYDVGGDVVNDVAGKAGTVFAGWLFPQPIGACGVCGRVRPWVRYQRYSYDDQTEAGDEHAPEREWDFGVDYVICGHNARWTTFWGRRKDACGCEEDIFRTGVQLIF